MKTKGYIDIKEIELTKPDNFEDIIRNTDELFAELLLRYYANKGNYLTNIIDKCKIKKMNKE